MYVNPFLAGILSTILVELLAILFIAFSRTLKK